MNNNPNDTNVLVIENAEFNLPLRIEGFTNEKDCFSFVKAVEKMVRCSPEYRLWTSYILETLGKTKCEFTGEDFEECPIEIHHHPICLFTVVKTVMEDFITKKLPFSTFDIATKTIELHFQNKIGYVVMLSDLHAKYHRGYLQIPVEMVNGDYLFLPTHYTIEDEEYKRILSLCSVHKDALSIGWSKDSYPGINGQIEEKKILTIDDSDSNIQSMLEIADNSCSLLPQNIEG